MSCDDGDCLQCGRSLDGPPKHGCVGCDAHTPVPSDYERGVAEGRARVVALLRGRHAFWKSERGLVSALWDVTVDAHLAELGHLLNHIEAGK